MVEGAMVSVSVRQVKHGSNTAISTIPPGDAERKNEALGVESILYTVVPMQSSRRSKPVNRISL